MAPVQPASASMSAVSVTSSELGNSVVRRTPPETFDKASTIALTSSSSGPGSGSGTEVGATHAPSPSQTPRPTNSPDTCLIGAGS